MARNKVLEDRSSRSNPHQVTVSHLQWDVKVDFEACILRGVVKYTLQRVDPNTAWLSLDTSNLKIKSVCDQVGNPLEWTLEDQEKEKEYLGSQLDIDISESTSHVEITYETTPQSSALQWLPPSQTAGKQYPYLFTQCQAIHARSLLPCQDRPGVKVTYRATVTVPSWSVCVMSAVQMICKEASDKNAKEKVYIWMQDVPISSYLIAMAVGQLERREISPRCAVWSEPAIVDVAAKEYSQTEDFLKMAEAIAGMPYVWGRYDLLCMPPSFPYGGMENPCLTFITPTTLAGDKSLADVVAHEIAHSWTGNLVTNATWDHFWLNEGWTTWLQRKIMARIHKDDKFLDFDALGGYKDLRDTIGDDRMPDDFKKLVLNIGDRDPDDSYSIVAYEKGFNLIMALERRVGKEAFEFFFQAYIKNFANKTLTSDDFQSFFMSHFSGNEAVKDFAWEKWLHEAGMPPEEPNFDRSLALEAEKLAAAWEALDLKGESVPKVDITSWTSNQKICFLDNLQIRSQDKPLQLSTLNAIHKEYGFGESQNAEILFRYCQLALAAEDESMILVVLKFVTSQGRMKFTRPLYRALFATPKWRQLAKAAFLEHKDFYHPICSKMVANDLLQIESTTRGTSGSLTAILGDKKKLAWVTVCAALVLGGVVLARRRK